VISTLREKFGDDLGAGDKAPSIIRHDPDCPINDLNDERVLKMNQNSIENYKKYIESVKEIRKGRLDDCYIVPISE